MRILKYEIPQPDDEGVAIVKLPHQAKIVSVGMQLDKMVLWAGVPSGGTGYKNVRLYVVNTGNEFSDLTGKFIGTVVSTNGIVWHILEAL